MSNLKATRERVGLTQSALASAVRMTQGAIAHYENGRRQPGLSACRKILDALNAKGADCSLDDVFPNPGSTCQTSSEGATDLRHPKSQSVTPRRGRRAGDLTAVQFTQRLANAKAGEFPPEFKATDEYLDD